MKKNGSVPKVDAVIDNTQASVGRYLVLFHEAQKGFEPSSGYKTHFNNSGVVSLGELRRVKNQGLARMVSACLLVLSERTAGNTPDETRLAASCGKDEAGKIVDALYRSVPLIKRLAARQAQLDSFSDAAEAVGQDLETYISRNEIKIDDDPFAEINTEKITRVKKASSKAEPLPVEETSDTVIIPNG